MRFYGHTTVKQGAEGNGNSLLYKRVFSAGNRLHAGCAAGYGQIPNARSAAADEKGNDRNGRRCPEGNGELVIV